MRIGQTSVVVFSSKLLASALGFVATVYFANVLGADLLGVYALVISLVAWLRLGGRVGVSRALAKRLSENREQGAYLTAGALFIGTLTIIIAAGTAIGHEYVEAYVDDFDNYASLSVVWFVIALFLFESATTVVNNTLKGQQSVHIFGLLQPLKIGVRSAVQILLVIVGLNIVGLLVGYMVGLAVIFVVGLLFVSIRPRVPEKRHFRSLYDYAKFSWLSGLKARALNDVDILVLGAFVSTNLVGVYSIAWSITKFLDLFGLAIGQSMFPEVSNVAAEEDEAAASNLIEDALAYGGFLTIPGLVGGFFLSDRLLMVYGPDFVIGTEVLWLLLLSIFVYGYMAQVLNALNALDRPKLAFYTNVVFIATNVCLNLVLVWQIGWVGAAIASVVSVSVGLVVAYYFLQTVVTVRLPVVTVSKQVASALLMGGVVWALRRLFEDTVLNEYNFVMVLLLVGIGTGIYVGTLLTISAKFRGIVARNLPVDLPFLA